MLRCVGVGWWWFRRRTKAATPRNTVEGRVDGASFSKCIDLILKKLKLKLSGREQREHNCVWEPSWKPLNSEFIERSWSMQLLKQLFFFGQITSYKKNQFTIHIGSLCQLQILYPFMGPNERFGIGGLLPKYMFPHGPHRVLDNESKLFQLYLRFHEYFCVDPNVGNFLRNPSWGHWRKFMSSTTIFILNEFGGNYVLV